MDPELDAPVVQEPVEDILLPLGRICDHLADASEELKADARRVIDWTLSKYYGGTP